jgi:hypothetical protein
MDCNIIHNIATILATIASKCLRYPLKSRRLRCTDAHAQAIKQSSVYLKAIQELKTSWTGSRTDPVRPPSGGGGGGPGARPGGGEVVWGGGDDVGKSGMSSAATLEAATPPPPPLRRWRRGGGGGGGGGRREGGREGRRGG